MPFAPSGSRGYRCDMASPTISIFARLPVPGQAKTRLIPAVGEEGAARGYARLLHHTVAQVRASGVPFASIARAQPRRKALVVSLLASGMRGSPTSILY